jgi:two-component system response regulator NreC
MRQISVLIVADEPIPRSALRELLFAQEGLRMVGECDLQTASQQVDTLTPDVVVVHIGVPGKRTLKFAQTVHMKSGVVLLSREADEAYVRSAFTAGVLAYVLVRGAPADLIRAIHAASVKKKFLDPLLKDIIVDVLLREDRLPYEMLSPRERQVLALLAHGYSNQQIADKLCLGRKSVDTYRQRIAAKLHLNDRSEIVRYALSMGLLGTQENVS